jgi:hypothetical protein
MDTMECFPGVKKGKVLSLETILFLPRKDMCIDRLRGLVARVPGYRFKGPGSILGTTRFSEN